MMIVGYRSNVNAAEGVRAVVKHTGKPVGEARKLIDSAIGGQSVLFDSDWVLREDLEDNGFIID